MPLCCTGQGCGIQKVFNVGMVHAYNSALANVGKSTTVVIFCNNSCPQFCTGHGCESKDNCYML